MPTFDFNCAPYNKHIRYLSCVLPNGRDRIEAGVFLHHALGLSAAQIKRIKYLEDGIFLDGSRITTRTYCHAGQTLRIRLSDTARTSDIPPSPGPLDILYEDEDLLVINKAPNIAVHPGVGHWDNTLGSHVLAYYDSKGIPADFHPVHRLDKGTSGLMLIAKHAFAQDILREAFHTSAFEREYLAVCDGVLSEPAGSITFPLAHSKTSVILQEVSPEGLPAHTDYQLLQRTSCRSLVALRLKTGRTHQIRVHMSAIGHPLTGDFLYGTENPSLIDRPALHSHHLAFLHPLTKEPLSFTAQMPDDMKALLEERSNRAL